MKHKKLLLTFLSTLLLFPLLAQEKTLPVDALVLKSPNGIRILEYIGYPEEIIQEALANVAEGRKEGEAE